MFEQTTALAFCARLGGRAEKRARSHRLSSRAQSEDSMEHLSAEERACLTYLEETIEALEVQEDSGLSNDEPESGKIDDARVGGG